MFYNKNLEVFNNFVDICKYVFKYDVKINLDRYEARIYSKEAYKELLDLGDASTKSWEIPKKFLKKPQAIEWIRAMFDCEATVGHYNYCRYIFKHHTQRY